MFSIYLWEIFFFSIPTILSFLYSLLTHDSWSCQFIQDKLFFIQCCEDLLASLSITNHHSLSFSPTLFHCIFIPSSYLCIFMFSFPPPHSPLCDIFLILLICLSLSSFSFTYFLFVQLFLFFALLFSHLLFFFIT